MYPRHSAHSVAPSRRQPPWPRSTAIRRAFRSLALGTALVWACASAFAATDRPGAFARALAAAASSDEAAAEWYRTHDYGPLWTGEGDAARRLALFEALESAPDHGLPPARYGAAALRTAFAEARTEGDLGRLEAAMTHAFLTWAHDLTSGMLDPRAIDPTIVRETRHTDPQALLAAIAGGDPAAVLAGLLPRSPVYAQLVKAKLGLEAQIAAGGWGPEVPGGALAPGESGPRVVALRDRLVAMGWLAPSATRDYDRRIQAAVQAFQRANGLNADGVAGAATIAAINVPPEERLKSVIVAMERERWLDIDRSGRLIWVNLPDFTARIIDDGREVFRTRAVIGREDADRRTPEFSDEMEHLVVNPSWSVPRSITVKEYLPMLQRNPNAAGHLQVIDSRGRVVSRGAVNFAAYSAKSFPFALRQPPSDGNALGKVKFMFPNPYNIYLHDTPTKYLFAEEKRAYSHGCIRLADPMDFAHVLLSAQSDEAEAEFRRYLKGGPEQLVKLREFVPVHLVYFTAYPDMRGRIGYRGDVYGRDGRIWAALAAAGVTL